MSPNLWQHQIIIQTEELDIRSIILILFLKTADEKSLFHNLLLNHSRDRIEFILRFFLDQLSDFI